MFESGSFGRKKRKEKKRKGRIKTIRVTEVELMGHTQRIILKEDVSHSINCECMCLSLHMPVRHS